MDHERPHITLFVSNLKSLWVTITLWRLTPMARRMRGGESTLSATHMNKRLIDPSKATKLTALVVEDNMVNQTIHHRLLESLGIQNQVVGNGKEAVDVHSSGKYFDLILMDMDMPVMNGIEATRKLRAMGIRSTIAGVSTRSLEREKQEFLEAGLDDYQEKPLTTAKIVSVLHKINHSG